MFVSKEMTHHASTCNSPVKLVFLSIHSEELNVV